MDNVLLGMVDLLEMVLDEEVKEMALDEVEEMAGLAEEALRVQPSLVWRKRERGVFARSLYLSRVGVGQLEEGRWSCC